MVHKLFQLRLQEAEQRKKELEQQVASYKAKMHELLLADKHAQAEECQTILERLRRQLALATEKVKAVEGTKATAEQEAEEAKKELEEALPRLKELSRNLPVKYRNILKKIEEMDDLLDDFTQNYMESVDRDYEVKFLSQLIEQEVDIPPAFQFDPSPLPEFAHKLKSAAQVASFPNAQIKWQHRFAELEHIERKEEKRKRRKEAGYTQQPDTAFAAVGY